MEQLQKIVVLCIAFFITACAATRPPLPDVKLPPERISQNGYSLMPLNEKGWMIRGRDTYEFVLVKQGENPDETFAIQANLSKLSVFNTTTDFVRLIKEGQAKDTNPQRFKLLKHEVAPFPMKGIDCVKSSMITEDNAAAKKSGDTGDMILEALTLSCAHPSEKSVGIHVTYSHRHYPGQEDAAFIEKGESILKSVELFEPDHPYISAAQKSNLELANKFSTLCSKIIGQTSLTQAGAIQEKDTDFLGKLSALGVTVERESSGNKIGTYALFEEGQDDVYSLVSIQSAYIEPKDLDKQEVLFVSAELDKIAPAFAKQVYLESRQAFRCESGSQFVTGIDSSYRSSYNPCDSSLTSASNIGSAVVANTLLTFLSLGANVVSGSSVTFVDTDKSRVAKLVVNSRLLQCLKEAKLNGTVLK